MLTKIRACCDKVPCSTPAFSDNASLFLVDGSCTLDAYNSSLDWYCFTRLIRYSASM